MPLSQEYLQGIINQFPSIDEINKEIERLQGVISTKADTLLSFTNQNQRGDLNSRDFHLQSNPVIESINNQTQILNTLVDRKNQLSSDESMSNTLPKASEPSLLSLGLPSLVVIIGIAGLLLLSRR